MIRSSNSSHDEDLDKSDSEIIEQARPVKLNHKLRPNEKSLRCRNCDGSGHYKQSCPFPSRGRQSFCHVCKQLGHDSLVCPTRQVSCRKCGKLGHEAHHCQEKTSQGKSENIDSFFQESSSVGQVHYRRMVSIEESLSQTQANVSALMQVEQSKELLDFAERRRLP